VKGSILLHAPLRLMRVPTWGESRRGEPVSAGVPLPRGVVAEADGLRLLRGGQAVPLQAKALDRWPDGSVRWVLLDWQADAAGGAAEDYVLTASGQAESMPPPPLQIATDGPGERVEVDTGRASFVFAAGGAFPFSSVSVVGSPVLDALRSGVAIGLHGAPSRLFFDIRAIRVREHGPLRAQLELSAVERGDFRTPLAVVARVELFANSAVARVAVRIRNMRRARHPNGIWVLGDDGSLMLDSAALVLAGTDAPSNVFLAAEEHSALEAVELPLEIHQESSGGEHWDGATHVNRDGRVAARFRGYRVRSGVSERFGFRASPVVVADGSVAPTAVAVPQFWQNFPRAITVDGHAIEVQFFPAGSAEGHELQGGEQKTHVAVLSFGRDDVSDPPLAWVHDPSRFSPTPEWVAETGAIPFLTPASADSRTAYLALVGLALDAKRGFIAKREAFDEYGWRHFGDMPADHESAFQPADRPFVSHYNNQYDAVAACAVHFLRTGHSAWWALMDDLARHVVDIDIYHTTEDKAAYNGGLFWHTEHYVDAGASTHRTYPRGTRGGGPSAEHNYTSGLMLHYFLTGLDASREAAVGLAQWVLDMDDGSKSPFRWLASGPTGLASASGSAAYHGPGRGSANSILACLVGYRLTGDTALRAKAEELIQRCIRPDDDLAARNLLDVERRWFYTVFLQVLGVYLQEKAERGELDTMYAYARASLLHYAGWMTVHERPYLERPAALEFPTETWAAQDLRKAEVFRWAAGHATGAVRRQFVERGQAFFDYAVRTLGASPTRHFTRPLVLVLRNGVEGPPLDWLDGADALWPRATSTPDAETRHFEPQKVRALRRAVWGVATGLVLVAILSALVWMAVG
jgi:hypothetical protein